MRYWFIYASHMGGYYASQKYLGREVFCEECRDYDFLVDEGYESDLLYGNYESKEEYSWKEEISRAKLRRA